MSVVITLNTNTSSLQHPQSAFNTTGQRTKQIKRMFTITNGDSIGSSYLLGELPDTAIVDNIVIDGPTTAGVTSADVSLFDSKGVVKAVAYYGAALNLSSSAGTATSTYASSFKWMAHNAVTVANSNNQVWQDAGDVEGPYPASGAVIKDTKYQIGLVLNAAATATGTYVATINYISTE